MFAVYTISRFQFSAKTTRQVIVDPTDIKIFETTPEGDETAADVDPAVGGPEAYEDDERGGWGNKLDFLFREDSLLKNSCHITEQTPNGRPELLRSAIIY